MAGAGCVVLYCNPRGSDGYGRDFWHANRCDWGDGPMRDVLAGVELACGRDYIDSKRLCLTGGSYAGYLTAWIIGRDHRFAAACSQRGVYNLVSMRNTTDIPFFNDRETGGITPWDDVAALWAMSPISLAPNVQTPLLIEHSEQDYRVPIEQAEQLFQALRLMKKKVELVRWPREGHELSRAGEPRHRIERIRRMIEWFNEHTEKQDGGKREPT
jgi:dipeptidyl aminopeptidase/acylaminoacyl peptidase